MDTPSLELRIEGKLAFSSRSKWLHPLFELEAAARAQGFDPSRGELYDKVVGRGSAFLITRLGIRRVHAGTLSRLGAEVLERQGIAHTWEVLVERIDCATEGLLERVTDVGEACRLLEERARRVAR